MLSAKKNGWDFVSLEGSRVLLSIHSLMQSIYTLKCIQASRKAVLQFANIDQAHKFRLEHDHPVLINVSINR